MPADPYTGLMFRLRLAAAMLVLAAALAVLLLPLPLPRNAITYALEDAGHLPLAVLLASLCLWVLAATSLSLRDRCLITLALGCAFGAGSELLQGLTGRDASWNDLRSDTIGVVAAIAAFYLWTRRRGRLAAGEGSGALRATAALLLIGAAVSWLLPLGHALQAWREREQRFPVLYQADFLRTEFVLSPVGSTVLPLTPRVRGDRRILPVQCGATRFSGVTLDGLPRNWTRWHALRIDVANPGTEPFDLGVLVREARRRIAYDERYNLELTLAVGESRSIVLSLADVRKGPRGRPLDLSRVGTIGIFCAGKAREFELLRVALE